MKKKLFLLAVIVAVLACIFTISVSAAEPDTTKESVTLADGTVCPLWDTDGNPLIWYIKSTDESGVNTYGYVDATSEAVNCYANSKSTYDGATCYTVSNITITVDGVEYSKQTLVVINLRGEVLAGSGNYKGQLISGFSTLYGSNTKQYTLQYFYAPLGTIAFAKETFKNCEGLKYVNLSELTELRYIGSQDFNGCPNLFAGQKLDLSNTKLVTVDTNGLSSIAATEIVFPATLTKIVSCFQSCKYVTKITFNNQLTTVTMSFNGCNALEEVVGSDFSIVTAINNNTFNSCYNLKKVEGLFENGVFTVPNGITSVGTSSFQDVDELVTINLPSSVTSIGEKAFYGCDKLVTINMPGVTEVSKEAFRSCSSIVTMDFSNVDVINGNTFNGCSSLQFIKLSPNLTSIGNVAFGGCSSLQALSIDSCTTIGYNAFLNCTALKAVYLPEGLTTLGGGTSYNGYGNGTFCDTKNVYFVSKPFSVTDSNGNFYTKENFVQPTKPDVYYMPSTLSEMYGVTFRTCDNINPVVVFPEALTQITCWEGAFSLSDNSGNGVTYVFLGNMEKFCFSGRDGRYNNISFLFANPNDTGIESMTFQLGYKTAPKNSYAYFCASKTAYNLNSFVGSKETYVVSEGEFTTAAYTGSEHIRAPKLDVTQGATCTLPAGTFTYCFCKTLISSETVEGSVALGHDSEGAAITIYYPELNGAPNYFANSYHAYVCQRCSVDVDEEKDETALFTEKGYSKEVNGNIFTYGISLNKAAEKAYVDNGNVISYGFIIGIVNGTDGNIVNADGTSSLEKYIMTDFASSEYTNFSIYNVKMLDLSEEQKTWDVYCCAYVIDDDKVYYAGETVTTEALTISYAKIPPITETPDSGDEE